MISIAFLRKKNKLTQQQLATMMGVPRSTVAMWETGRAEPSISNILALCKIFHISTDSFLENVAGGHGFDEILEEYDIVVKFGIKVIAYKTDLSEIEFIIKILDNISSEKNSYHLTNDKQKKH